MDTAVEVRKPKKTGAPTSYREEYPAMLIEYFEARPLVMRTLHSADATSAEQARAVCSQVPTMQGFAQSIGVSEQTLRSWEGKHPDFALARARGRDIQQAWFAEALTTGAANPTGAIFVAKNMIGWKDKTEVETTVSADVAGMDHMRRVLSSASPDQLQRFASLMEEMEAGVPKQIESSQ